MENSRCFLLLCGIVFSAVVGVTGANRPPEWQDTLREALHITGIREDVQPGSVIGVLRATDADGDRVTYSTNSDYFNVEASTGKLTLSLSLDRETNAEVSVTFRATDGNSEPVDITYSVKILDVNDNSPVFSNVPYSTVVAEDTHIGTEVFTDIHVTDRDSGLNAALQLTCYVPEGNSEARTACDTFKVNQHYVSDGVYTGSLALRHSVQYKTKSRYILILRAMDEGSTPRQTVVSVAIEVRDTQDDPPEFLYTPLSLVIYENIPVGSSVGELKARDQDVGSPNPLQLSIVSDPRSLFSLGESVQRSDGVVTTVIRSKGVIDREQIGSNYEFTVEAAEVIGGRTSTSNDHKVSRTVKVLVRDKNDQSPTFNKRVYDITIDEELARGRSLPDLDIIVNDNDLVENAYFELRILNKEARKIFALSPTNGTRSAAVSIVVQEPRFLDYDQSQYRSRVIELMAIETRTTEQHSTRATVNIHLRDINDHSPQFPQTSYTTSVMENRPVGYLIRTITATDADSGVFKQVTYSLEGSLSEKFNVDSTRGIITLAEKLDYESEKVISLMFKATDGGGRSNSVPFRVNVLDYNDQGPVFDADHYQTFVDESSTKMSPNITIHAVDIDSDRDVTYRIQSGNTRYNAFEISRKTGLFTLKHKIDYRDTPNNQGFFPVIIEASDNDRPPVTATTTVVVTVRDENNHSPVFGNTVYSNTVTEISPPGTSVEQVSATDMDFDDNGKIGFVLHTGSRDNFAIDYYTGLVQVAPNANLDIEQFGQLYTMIAYAIDNGSPQRTGTAQVIITVTDSNNKLPTFAQDLYRWSVQETVPIGTVINTLTANDPDIGARLEYHIQDNSITAKDKNGNPVTLTTPFNYKTAFTVGSTSGAVMTHSILSRDQVAEVTFVVRATDKNAEQPPLQIGSATVIITIRQTTEGDITFQRPWSADNPEFRLNVSEEEATGPSNVILRLVATDPRTGQQLRVFREVPNSDPNNYFTVEPDTGEIYINRRLDYETMQNKHISFQVEALSGDTIPGRRSAIATVIVQVIDVNDHNPHFQRNTYQLVVSESSRYPTRLDFVAANDEDSGSFGNITYSLSGPGANMFIINPLTGIVTVAPNVTLDRERKSEYTLTVNATDNVNGPGVKRSTIVSLVIRVRDENDNKPRFEQSEYDASALETLGSETSLVRVHAIDTDTGSNGQITYRVVGGGEGLFYIKKGTDVIVTKKPLNGHARETPYVLTVEGRDGGVPPLATTTTVTILVNTMQTAEGKPRLEFPPEDGYHVNVTEGRNGRNVTRIRAHSGVAGTPGDLTYYFFRGNKMVQDIGPFHIDKNTGEITTTREVDREKKPLYELTIVVEGQGNPPKRTIRRIFINVQDDDDNIPSFKDCPPSRIMVDPVEAHVLEENPNKVRVTRVTACDADSPPYNVIHYVITSGNVDPRSEQDPFWINMTSGEIWTVYALDRETKERYILTVEARTPEHRNSSESGNRKRREVDHGQRITVIVIVDDVDDNKPSFAATGASGNTVTAGVLASAPYGSNVVRMYAVDRDQSRYAANKYSISNIVFHKPDSDDRNIPDAFSIAESTGVISTKLPSYFDFVYGYFQMTVHVTGPNDKDPSTATLILYIVRSNQRLRFVFNDRPEMVRNPSRGSTFINAMVNQLLSSQWKIYTDNLHYHVEKDAEVNFNKTDLCFHVVKDNHVVNPDEALQIFQEMRSDKDVVQLYHNYSVEDVGLCEVKVTTRWWSGYWYLWWILIAFALFILIVCLILICCVCCACCYCYTSPKEQPYKYRPSIILEPVSHAASAPIVVTSTARTAPNDDFEWQEKIITMD